MGRRLAPDEKALWGKVMATVKPLEKRKVEPNPPRARLEGVAGVAQQQQDHAKHGGGVAAVKAKSAPLAPPSVLRTAASPIKLGGDKNSLDATWDRRIHRGGIVPDIAVDLHENTLSGAYARLDRTLEQAIHQKLRVILLVTGHVRGHDRASGQGRGAIAAVVRDWLAVSRHASAISAVRQAHPRHGGAGALYIVLKR